MVGADEFDCFLTTCIGNCCGCDSWSDLSLDGMFGALLGFDIIIFIASIVYMWCKHRKYNKNNGSQAKYRVGSTEPIN